MATDAFGEAGGIACYNRDLLTALAEVDRVQAIQVLPRFGDETLVNEKLHQKKGRNQRLQYSLAAVREAWSFRPDRILCGHLFMLPLAGLLSRMMGVPVWLQLHGIEAWTMPSKAVMRALKQVDLVTCVSRFTRQRFLAWANVDPVEVRVLPNTVSGRFAPQDRAACRAAWDLGDGPVLLTVGRLAAAERYKGHDRVLNSLPELMLTHPSLVYLVAGTGEDLERLQQLALDLDVANTVRFLGSVSSEDLPRLFNAADLFVMPSTGEGFGIVYLESMACGTPALGLDVDGSRDPLRDGNLGVVATKEGLAAAIIAALAAGRPEQLSARVEEVFGHAVFARQVSRLVDRMTRLRVPTACAA